MPPFDNLDVRRAVAMALDRKAFVERRLSSTSC